MAMEFEKVKILCATSLQVSSLHRFISLARNIWTHLKRDCKYAPHNWLHYKFQPGLLYFHY